MQDTSNLKQQKTTNPYDEEPVFYCKHCLSLRVMPFTGSIDICDECNKTDIGQASIFEWEQMYEEKYGHKFINKH